MKSTPPIVYVAGRGQQYLYWGGLALPVIAYPLRIHVAFLGHSAVAGEGLVGVWP